MKLFLAALFFLACVSSANAAITFVNASAEAHGDGGNLTLNAPSSPQTDDVWLACVHTGDNVAHSFSDWTQIYQGNGGSAASRLSFWYVRYAGSTPNLTVSHTAGGGTIGGIAAFRGVKTSGSPIDTSCTGTGGAGSLDDTIEITGCTPGTANTLLVICNGIADNAAITTVSNGFTATFEDDLDGTQNNYEYDSLTVQDVSVALHYKTHTSGATGDFTDTMASAEVWASVMIALEAQIDASFGPLRRRGQ